MEANANVQEPPDVSAAEHTSHAVVMRILNLRWMEVENDAERMQAVVPSVDPMRPCPAPPCRAVSDRSKNHGVGGPDLHHEKRAVHSCGLASGATNACL